MTHSVHVVAAQNRWGSKVAFTLTELMVVIAIIGILAVISMPVISRITESARRNQAQNEVAALATALRAYLDAYSVWPTALWGTQMGPEGLPVDAEIIELLSGHEDMADFNRRRITFMEFPERALEANEFRDPWGNELYRFAVNLDYGNQILVEPDDHDPVTVRQTVAVWSTGAPNNELIASW